MGCVSRAPLAVTASTTVAPSIGLSFASLAVTVIVETSLPSGIEAGAATTVDCAAERAPAVTVNAPLVAPVSPGDDAASVYPVPDLSTLRPAKLATPSTAATGPPPVSVPPPGLVSIAKATGSVAPVTRLVNWSRISTSTGGVILAPAVALVGCTRKTR